MPPLRSRRREDSSSMMRRYKLFQFSLVIAFLVLATGGYTYTAANNDSSSLSLATASQMQTTLPKDDATNQMVFQHEHPHGAGGGVEIHSQSIIHEHHHHHSDSNSGGDVQLVNSQQQHGMHYHNHGEGHYQHSVQEDQQQQQRDMHAHHHHLDHHDNNHAHSQQHSMNNSDGKAPFCGMTGMPMPMVMFMDGFHWSWFQHKPATPNCLNFYFPSWTLLNVWKFNLAVLCSMLLAILTESLSSVRVSVVGHFKKNHSTSAQQPQESVTTMWILFARILPNTKLQKKLCLVTIYMIQQFMGYFLMLLAMTYSLEILVAVAVGLGLGNMYVEERQSHHQTHHAPNTNNNNNIMLQPLLEHDVNEQQQQQQQQYRNVI